MHDRRSQIEDELLVLDAQDGDSTAMEALVGRWQKRLWHHALRLTGDRDAAWDVTQQAWLGIVKGLQKLHDPANFRAWAYRITANKSADWIREKTALRELPLRDAQDRKPCAVEDRHYEAACQSWNVKRKETRSEIRGASP